MPTLKALIEDYITGLGANPSTTLPTKVVHDALQQFLVDAEGEIPEPVRTPLPRDRDGRTFRFVVTDREGNGTFKGYFTVNTYVTGLPGELFISLHKAGSTFRGLFDVIATLVSIGLQYGVPVRTMVGKLRHQQFPPTGLAEISGAPDLAAITECKSVIDLIAHVIGRRYLNGDVRDEPPPDITTEPPITGVTVPKSP